MSPVRSKEVWEDDEVVQEDLKETEQEEDEDAKYKLLMSDRNKETLLRIQLQHLARDHPHSMDFYHTTLKVRKAAGEADEVQKLLRKLYPLYRFGSGNADDTNDVANVDEELSKALGSVKVSRASRPKNALDRDIQEALKMPEAAVEDLDVDTVTSPRKALMIIEKLYEYLLAYDEAVTRTVMLGYKSSFDVETQEESLTKITALLANDNVLQALICFEKGWLLLGRVLDVLGTTMGTEILARVLPFTGLSELNLDDTKLNRIYMGIHTCLSEAKRKEFDVLLTHLTEENMKKLTDSEVGVTFLLEFLHYFKHLSANAKGDFPSLWIKVANLVTESLGSLDTISTPLRIPKGLRKQLAEDQYICKEYKQFWDALITSFVDAGTTESE